MPLLEGALDLSTFELQFKEDLQIKSVFFKWIPRNEVDDGQKWLNSKLDLAKESLGISSSNPINFNLTIGETWYARVNSTNDKQNISAVIIIRSLVGDYISILVSCSANTENERIIEILKLLKPTILDNGEKFVNNIITPFFRFILPHNTIWIPKYKYLIDDNTDQFEFEAWFESPETFDQENDFSNAYSEIPVVFLSKNSNSLLFVEDSETKTTLFRICHSYQFSGINHLVIIGKFISKEGALVIWRSLLSQIEAVN